MNIVKCGSKVKSVLTNIEGIITAASIRFNSVAYEVSYFNNGEYKQVWLNESEFELSINTKKETIGFKKN